MLYQQPVSQSYHSLCTQSVSFLSSKFEVQLELAFSIELANSTLPGLSKRWTYRLVNLQHPRGLCTMNGYEDIHTMGLQA
jgi:hypothetical protein